MKLSKEQLEKLKMKEGRVLVEIDALERETLTVGDTTIFVKLIGDESRSVMAKRCGTVYKTPVAADLPKLNYAFKGEMEVEVGDRVWWSANATGNLMFVSKQESTMFEVDGKTYLVIPYSELLARKRGDDVLALNDRVLGRKVEPTVKSTLDLSLSDLSKPPRDVFDVVYPPSGKGYYSDGRYMVKCEVGERVKLKDGGSMIGQLEDEYTRELEELYYFRSSDIVAK